MYVLCCTGMTWAWVKPFSASVYYGQYLSLRYCTVNVVIYRTLLKQGAYGGKPVVKRALVVTPGSLVKVGVYILYIYVSMYGHGYV